MTRPDQNNKLLVIAFDDPIKAQEFLLTAARLQKQDELRLHDAVFVRRDADGSTHVTETTDITPGRAAIGGGAWGLLLGTLFTGPFGIAIGAASAGAGALVAKLVDSGIKDDKIKELRERILPGHTALALLISHVSVADLQRELSRFPGAMLVETDMPPAAVSAVQNALAEGATAPQTDVQPAGGPL